jgi:hypothetical protein
MTKREKLTARILAQSAAKQAKFAALRKQSRAQEIAKAIRNRKATLDIASAKRNNPKR